MIRDDVFTQNSGVALDFGMGSQGVVDRHGGILPAHFGADQIDDNLFENNGTNGAFAWKAPFVKLTGNSFVDDNLFNTQLGSEAYLKIVDESPGVMILHNYFFSDQDYSTLAIWLDSEVQDSRVSRNVFVDTGGVMYEADLANNLFDDNILLNRPVGPGQPIGGVNILEASGVYVVQNLFVNQGAIQISNHYAPDIPGTVENDDGVARRMVLYKPGTLTSLGLRRVHVHQNLFMNNIFYRYGITKVLFNEPSTYNEAELDSGDLAQYLANRFWDNRVDFNVYYNGAQKVNDYDPSLALDQHSVTVPGNHDVTYRCSPTSCVIDMQVDARNTPESLGAPAITGSYVGPSELLPDDRPASITTDFFGHQRPTATSQSARSPARRPASKCSGSGPRSSHSGPRLSDATSRARDWCELQSHRLSTHRGRSSQVG